MSDAEFTAFLKTVFEQLAVHSMDGAIHFQCIDWRHIGEMLEACEAAYAESQEYLRLVKGQRRHGLVLSLSARVGLAFSSWNNGSPPGFELAPQKPSIASVHDGPRPRRIFPIQDHNLQTVLLWTRVAYLRRCDLQAAVRSRAMFCLLAGSASMSMSRAMVASAYIRQLRSGLPLCCMHGQSRR
jgi:hypothetical protein